jgi:hypothetical protein
MYLRRWHRVGIILSVAWAIGGAVWATGENWKMSTDASYLTFKGCYEAASARNGGGAIPQPEYDQCMARGLASAKPITDRTWNDAAVVAFGPLPFAWLIAFMVLGLYRWVQRGADGGPARRSAGLPVRQEPFIAEPPKH